MHPQGKWIMAAEIMRSMGGPPQYYVGAQGGNCELLAHPWLL